MIERSSPVVLVLASGQGRRFVASGGRGSKLQAMLGGKTVLARTLDAVRTSGLPWHVEDAGHEGMGDSIAAAVRATPDAGGWLVLPGDLPLIQPESLRRVAASLAEPSDYSVVLPRHDGKRGHPVGFGRGCYEALSTLTGAEGAARIVKAEMAARRTHFLDLDDAGVVTDIDTIDDLAAAERLIVRRG